jgi:hypothetical protein
VSGLFRLETFSSMSFILVDNQGSEMRILIVWLEEFRDDLDSILPSSLIFIVIQTSHV